MDKQDLTRVMSNDLDLGRGVDEEKARSKKRDREEPPRKAEKRTKKRREIQPEEEDEAAALAMEESLEGIRGSPPKDPIPRRKKIQKIEAWFATFPSKLEKIRENVDLESMDETQLDSLQMEIKQIMGSTGGGSMGEMLPLAGLTLYESVLVSCGINVQGISNLAFDPNFKQACQEVMLEYSDMTYIPPHYRILFYVANASYALHDKNSAKAKDTAAATEGQRAGQSGQSGLKAEDLEMLEAGKNYQAGKNS